MDGEAASSMPLILINLVFATLALAIGFVAGAWFLGGRKQAADSPDSQEDKNDSLEKHLALERAMLATSRLKDVAAGVANDVGQHNLQVEQITADLKAVSNAPTDKQSAEVAKALTRIVEANNDLQSRLAKAEEQIKAQADEIRAHESEARTDSLTKVANRRAFDDQLAQRFAEWQRKATPFSMMILDVDHFKKFNDTHGHQAGDEVLRQVAKAISSTVREMDITCRYGGEEFAVILPATISRDAVGLVERARKAIEELRINFNGKTLCVTASFGLAEICQADDEVSLLRRADDALYASKDAGRNCGHRHDGDNPVPLTAGASTAASRPKTAESAPPSPRDEERVPAKTLDLLPNRTQFIQELRRRIAECHRTDQKLSVIAIEFDAFAKLRDEYGQAVATLTFDSLAQFLKNMQREMDLLGRLDDGQLALMLPSAERADAEMIAERAYEALAKCSAPIGGEQLQLTCSMGVADLQADDTAAGIVKRATDIILAKRGSMAAV